MLPVEMYQVEALTKRKPGVVKRKIWKSDGVHLTQRNGVGVKYEPLMHGQGAMAPNAFVFSSSGKPRDSMLTGPNTDIKSN